MRLLNLLDYGVIIAYLVVLSAISYYHSRRQKTASDYYLGNRQLHWYLAGGSIMATLLSTISYLAVPGEMIRHGVGFMTGLLAIPLVLPVIAWVLIPLYARLPATSAYAYLEERFSPSVRSLAALVFLIKMMIWMGLIIYTASLAFQEVTGWSFATVVIVIGLFTTLYASSGGFRAVVWTDNLQLLILMGGALAIPIFVAVSIGTGPLEWWSDFSRAGRDQVQVFSLDPTIRITLVGMIIDIFFFHLCVNGGDQVVIQRYLSTPSESAARRSLVVYGLANMLLLALLMFTGLALFAFYLSQSSSSVQLFQQEIAPGADRLMPNLIARQLPAGISGLLLAALLAAAMSSISSAVNSFSGVLISDFLKGKARRLQSGLLLERTVSVLAGLLGIAAAFILWSGIRQTGWNLVEVAARVNNLLVGPLASLFFSGILWRRCRAPHAWGGFTLAATVSLLVSFSGQLLGWERQISFMWVIPGSFLAGILASWILSVGTGHSDRPVAGDESRPLRSPTR